MVSPVQQEVTSRTNEQENVIHPQGGTPKSPGKMAQMLDSADQVPVTDHVKN